MFTDRLTRDFKWDNLDDDDDDDDSWIRWLLNDDDEGECMSIRLIIDYLGNKITTIKTVN